MKMLAPEKKLLWKAKQGKISQEEYALQYMAQVRGVFDPQTLYKELQNRFTGRDIVFLCFEKKGEFCHRRLLAKWLEEALDITVQEL